MARKFGLIGGVGWPGTLAYYEAICRLADCGQGSPEMTIESLDMARTLAARGRPGDDESWGDFDRIFSAALQRLADAGCDVAAIASVTPHARLAAIAKSSSIPVVSIVEAVSSHLRHTKAAHGLVLGTSVTMSGSLFDRALEENACRPIRLSPDRIEDFTGILNSHFYSGQPEEGREKVLEFLDAASLDRANTIILLACTDLSPAFPEASGRALFESVGIRWLDSTNAHAEAILRAANI